MSSKTKILMILIAASVVSAILMSGAFLFLVQLHGKVVLKGSQGLILAGGVSLLCGLLIVALLNILLNKVAIVPLTEQEVSGNERDRLIEQLCHAQRMDAAGRLVSSIAHDFNNLLTIIDGYASLIIEDPASEETTQNAQEVVDSARKCTSIARNLLNFGYKEKTEPDILNLNTILIETEEMLSRLLGENVWFNSSGSKESIYIKMDPVEFGQVLMNLTVNARDAMPDGGKIIINAGCQEIRNGAHRKPADLPEGPYARISVNDTGRGIESHEIGRIFDPFFTTKAAGKGTGLGLSMVQTMIKQSGGFIDLISKPGEGSTFMIFLPIAPAPPIVVPGGSNKLQLKSTLLAEEGIKTILLVEDDPMILALIAQTLEQENYKVIISNDGCEAVQIARKYEGQIDLLFTDVIMCGLGGAELALAIRELYPEIKELFMSGYARTQVTDKGVSKDAALLEKPFTPDKVISIVHDLLGT